MAPHAKPSGPGGLSLYANLLDPSFKKDAAPSTISRAPVVFKRPAADDAQLDRAAVEKQQQMSAASLRFQPTKRPQIAAQKPKPKAPVQKPSALAPSPQLNTLVVPNTVAKPPPKTSIADWTGETDEHDVNGFQGPEKRQRGGRKKRKKNKEELTFLQNWDDIYDPSRPNVYEDYKHSDERIMEIREWKEKLYAHRTIRPEDSNSDSSGDRYEPKLNKQPPPPGLSFAPPPTLDDSDKPQNVSQAVNVLNDRTGEDAFTRRMRLSGMSSHVALKESPPVKNESVPALTLPQAKSSAPVPSISRAPVRYNLPVAPSEIPASEAELESALQMEETAVESAEEISSDAPRSLRPGQKGFAERLMSKYGWSKGSGLGASGSGIVNPLRVQVEKQKKKPDSEGGGFVGPGGMGKILGGKKKGAPGAGAEEGKFGTMSEVIVLRGMVDGLDLDAEVEGSGQGGLMQEVGEECGEKYGRVERVFIDRSNASKARVFVKFTSQLSALRAVNALRGRMFNGNIIDARFFDADKFESGVYE